MQVVVTFESRTGNTQRAAQLVAGGMKQAGADVTLSPIGSPDYKALAEADLIIVGTWTDGLFFFGQRPGGANKIASNLPELWDKRVCAYVTYAVNPGQSHDKLADLLSGLGARPIKTGAFHRKNLEADVTAFVDDIIEHFAA